MTLTGKCKHTGCTGHPGINAPDKTGKKNLLLLKTILSYFNT